MQWQVDKMTLGLDDKLIKWHVYEMASWLKWHTDKLTSWWNENLMK